MNDPIHDKKINVLMVDDEYLYRNSLEKDLLASSNIIIIGEASNGVEAVGLAKRLKPNVILMDIGMPLMNGIEATKIIKETNPEIKIIILTAHSDEDEAINSLIAGASAYSRKNLRTDYLIMVIETVEKGAIWLDPIIGNKVLSKTIEYYKKENKF